MRRLGGDAYYFFSHSPFVSFSSSRCSRAPSINHRFIGSFPTERRRNETKRKGFHSAADTRANKQSIGFAGRPPPPPSTNSTIDFRLFYSIVHPFPLSQPEIVSMISAARQRQDFWPNPAGVGRDFRVEPALMNNGSIDPGDAFVRRRTTKKHKGTTKTSVLTFRRIR